MSSLKRILHWQTRAFHHFLLSRKNTPYQWGVNDCALFAADGIQAQTGTDIASEFRGKYSDEASAYAAIKSICGGTSVADAAAWCAQQRGMAELKHPLMAQRGDLVIVENAGSLIAGLVHLNGREVAVVGDPGWFGVPITSVKRAWRVA
jgi:hypothetical protein